MAQKERVEIEERYKWNREDLYPSLQAWRDHKAQITESMGKAAEFRGHLADSAQALLDFLVFDSEIEKQLRRLALYASLLYDEDVSNADSAALTKEIEQVEVDYHQLTFFATPELAAIAPETYEAFMAQCPDLKVYSMCIDRILRQREHTLSDAEEALLATTSVMGDAPYSAYCVFTDAEMPHPSVTLSDGSVVELDAASFVKNRCSAVREDRQKVTKAFWDNYKLFEGTIGELMNGKVRQTLFYTKARKHKSCLERALSYNKIPEAVYHSLIENVNRCLPTFHRYLALKKRMLGVDRLEYQDLYAPAMSGAEVTYSYEEAMQMVLEAIAPLGEEYSTVVKKAFDERWIDVFPNRGKSSGAYSNGAAYDVHPYILMNYDGRYDSVGTLIHELGHTMQSYYSNKCQPYATCDYSIFVAEVASTFNEVLLDTMMSKKLTDRESRLFLLMSMLDGFKGTLFRQTQFAEFQLAMVNIAERGEPITGKVLTKLYLDITRKYYGHEAGVCHVDDFIGIEWAFIHHFYMGFYVYQYSTSFVASQALAEMVLNGEDGVKERYMDFLKAGDSKYPIEELADAGVDMLSPIPFDKAIAKMNKIMDEVEELLG